MAHVIVSWGSYCQSLACWYMASEKNPLSPASWQTMGLLHIVSASLNKPLQKLWTILLPFSGWKFCLALCLPDELSSEVTRLLRHPLHSISEDIRCLYWQFRNTTWFRRKGPPSPESLGRLCQSHSILLSRARDLGHIYNINLMWYCTVWNLLRCTLARDNVISISINKHWNEFVNKCGRAYIFYNDRYRN